jgi:diguanylate cyclase (GGDEF)-like protein
MDTHVTSWITPNPVVIDGSTSLFIALDRMAEKEIGAILVEKESRLAGIFTGRDLLRLLASNRQRDLNSVLEEPVERFMTANLVWADSADDCSALYAKMKAHNLRHIPVMEDGRLVGLVSMRDLVHFYQNKLEAEFNDARREIESLRKLVSVSNGERIDTLIREVEKYRELSLTDPLTGLFNKRYFQGRIVEEVSRARRYGEELSLIFSDIDHFKQINDRFGHPWGDHALQETAGVLSGSVGELHVLSHLRKSDIIARYGGEEFVVILPETARPGASAAAEKLRRSIDVHPYHIDGEEVHLTMSFGVAALSANDRDANDIVRNADYAMYLAKSSGRNRVMSHPDEIVSR